MDNQKIGIFISELRKSKSMTQKELAEKLNVTDKAVSKWERGLGYPEITITPLLAEQLGISVNELLLGERLAPEKGESKAAQPSHADTIISEVVEYVTKTKKQRAVRATGLAFTILSSAFLLAMFTCLLCNYAISRTFSWSLYVVGGEITAWLVITPLLLMKKHRFLVSIAGLTVSIVPLLLLIEYLCPVKNWVLPLALPIVILALVSLWASVLLVAYIKKAVRATNIALFITTSVFLLAIFTCLLCNYAIDNTISWSLYAVGGEVTAWLVIAPLLQLKKHRYLVSMAGLTVSIMPLLLLIEYLCPIKNWVIPFAFPIVIVTVASLWVSVFLFEYTKIKRLYLISLMLLLYGILDNLSINSFVSNYLNLSKDNISPHITAISCGFAAIVLTVIALFKQKKVN